MIRSPFEKSRSALLIATMPVRDDDKVGKTIPSCILSAAIIFRPFIKGQSIIAVYKKI